jgi:FkbM family methyltransferase
VIRVAVRNAQWNVVDGPHDGFWRRMQAGWETQTLSIIDRLVTPQTVFLDIGSWIGPIALYAATRAARVICVEADPVALGELRANLGVNPTLAAKTTVIDRAVHPTSARIAFGSRGRGGDSMSSSVLQGGETTWEVNTVTPAELAMMVPPGAPLFVKMDIEAGEYAVVPAADILWARPRTMVFLATHARLLDLPTKEKRRLTARMFAALRGYRAYRVRSQGGLAWTPVGWLSALGGAPLRRDWLFMPIR